MDAQQDVSNKGMSWALRFAMIESVAQTIEGGEQ